MAHADAPLRSPWFLQSGLSAGRYSLSPESSVTHGGEHWSSELSADAWHNSPRPPSAAPRAAPTNRTAIAAVVFAILCAPVGIILGHVACWQINRRAQAGRGLATVAMFVSYTVIAIPVVIYLSMAAVLVIADVADSHHRHPSTALISAP